MNKKKTLLICAIILLSGGAVTAFILLTEPTASRSGASKETAMLVEVTPAEQGTYRPVIVVTGTVQPSRDIILSPRVSGEVVSLAPNFIPGGFIQKGEVILQIDPADYRNRLALQKSALSQALADLQIEEGRQDIARKDYQLVDESLPDINEDLVLREPQLNAVKARVEAARAAVEQAELEVERTTIRAPFDAYVLSRKVNVGSQVAPAENLGRLVGREVYWVEATIPLSKLRWLSFPESEEEKGLKVLITDLRAWQEGVYRTGYLFKLIGALEDQTRLARVLISVPDPLALRSDSSELPPLIINAFVEARIQGKPLEDVVQLEREYVRQDETVWVMEEDKLSIREVDIALSTEEYAYITEGLQEGELVVKTNLSTVTEGAPLRLKAADTRTTAASPGEEQQAPHEIQNQGNY
ncbi:efflux RND transporter periplasmic adaptor subunit [Nafulsella turpanensis]|uniref:efflux RND transporter periplasmic adaptor subunit n=1 Tax=Nafulsella turpanensis TaxID=1265690 RepID=UPI00034AED26|nr:efflux RND transporter periplasmic adaptor subunit [Nafulsella turpanensis]